MESRQPTIFLRFSVIVPAFNAETTLPSCLNALGQQSVPKDDYEVIVVDDGSSDSTSKIARQFKMKCMYQANRGPAAARNMGAYQAKGDIILFTDADCVPDRRWLEEMTLPFEDPEVMGVKGAYKTRQKPLIARFAQAEFEDRYDLLRSQTSIDMIATYAAAFRKDIFLKMSGFDEHFPVANNEDTEFSYRLVTAGHKLVFNPKAFVFHTHPDTLWKYLRVKFWRGYWRMVVYRRYPEKAVKDSYTPGVIKIQTLLMALSMIFVPLSWFMPGVLYLAVLAWAIIIVSSFPFSFKTFKKDRVIGLISPAVLLLRSLVFASGSLSGMARCLFNPFHLNNSSTM